MCVCVPAESQRRGLDHEIRKTHDRLLDGSVNKTVINWRYWAGLVKAGGGLMASDGRSVFTISYT